MEPIPYARPFWDDEEIAAVARVIRSGIWTFGAVVREFEDALRSLVGTHDVLCVANGTSALYALLHLLRRRTPGRALYVTSALNFTAGASAALLLGYEIGLTDIESTTLNMAPASLEKVLSRAGGRHALIVVNPVHYAGVLADMDGIGIIAQDHGAVVFEDACHAIGAQVASHPSSLGAVFSFHPTKSVAAGEGGAIATNDPTLAAELRLFCNHAMARADFACLDEAFDENGTVNPWYYEIGEPGMNFRLSELHAAVGLCQVRRLQASLSRRRTMAARYREAFSGLGAITVHPRDRTVPSDLHLFPVELDLMLLGLTKARVFEYMREFGIFPQVHYTPLHRMPAFAGLDLVRDGNFVQLDTISRGLLSLPLYLGLRDDEQERVIAAVRSLCTIRDPRR